MKKRVYETLNTRRVEECYRNQIAIPHAYPTSVVLDITNRCNFQCPLCPTGSGKSGRPVGDMDSDLALQIIDECAEYTECITFGFSGEPLLHKELLRFISAASQDGCMTKMFTNLSVVPVGGYEALIQAGIDHIVVSLDGVNETQYSFYRKHGSFASVIDNIKMLIQANNRLNKLCGIIEAQMLVNKSNENSLEAFVSLCDKLGFDKAKLKYLNLGLDTDLCTAEEYLPKDKRLHYYQIGKQALTIREDFIQRSRDRICSELYYGPAIVSWDGRYILCCRDQRHEIDVGSFRSDSVWDYWNGDKLARMRKLQKEHKIDLCGFCPALFLDSFDISADSVQDVVDTVERRNAHPAAPPESAFLSNPDINDLPSMADWDGAKRIVHRGEVVDYGAYRTFKY